MDGPQVGRKTIEFSAFVKAIQESAPAPTACSGLLPPGTISYCESSNHQITMTVSLSEHDFLDLLGRGLTLDSIEQNMYRSMPARVEPRSELAQTLSRTHDLHGVPGFYRSENGDWRLSGNSGLLIPYCTAKGYIQGLQRRAEIGGKRCYVYPICEIDEQTLTKYAA